MPHKTIKVSISVFDTIFDRCEYWRKVFGNQSRSKFYNEAVMLHANNMSKWYPKYSEGEIDYIHGKGNPRIEKLRRANSNDRP